MTLSTIVPAVAPPAPAADGDDIPTEPIWRITVDQYHEMIRRGILADDDPVELLEGWLVIKMSKNPPHVLAADLAADMLHEVAPAGWHVKRQDPITTSDSEPEPDVALVRGTRRDYHDRHPGPSELGLVIEVADSTLVRDRTIKKRAYARAAVSVYWIINLVDRVVEVFTDPTGPAEQPDYRRRTDYREGDLIPLTLDGRQVATIAVRDLLP
jgi:Uma2 family endonuclease